MDSFPTIGNWVVCHVRPRCEKKLAAFCDANQAGVFLPLLSSEKQYGARKRVHTLPLFASYVFVRAEEAFQIQLKQNKNCANLLPVVDQLSFNEHMRALYMALENNASLEVVPFIETGKKVKVISGPFAGIEGLVQEIHGQDHIVINIDLIQQSVALKTDWSMLKPAE